MYNMLEYLKNIVPLRQTKKKSVYVSNVCPFTGYVSKRRPFRINTKLKVCKCYHCGGSAKELYMLKLRVEQPDKAVVLLLEHDALLTHSLYRKEIIAKRLREIKDKAATKHDVIAKPELDLPF